MISLNIYLSFIDIVNIISSILVCLHSGSYNYLFSYILTHLFVFVENSYIVQCVRDEDEDEDQDKDKDEDQDKEEDKSIQGKTCYCLSLIKKKTQSQAQICLLHLMDSHMKQLTQHFIQLHWEPLVHLVSTNIIYKLIYFIAYTVNILLYQSVTNYVIIFCLTATTSNKQKRCRNQCKDFARKKALGIIPIIIPPNTQGVVGPNAITFTTRVGYIVRNYAEFHHFSWTKVPEDHV